MASLEKRGPNSWRFTVELGFDAEGKRIRHRKSVSGFTKREAEIELAKFITEVKSGNYFEPEKMVLSKFIEDWKVKYAEKQLEALTYRNYMFHIKNHILPFFGHMRLDQVKALHVVSFLTSLSSPTARKDGQDKLLSSSTIQYIYRVLRNIFNVAVEWRVINHNPVADVKKPKVTLKEVNVFSEEEVASVFTALESEPLEWRLLITLALTLGMRRGELLALEWPQVDLENAYLDVKQSFSLTQKGNPLLKVPKTKSSLRRISIPSSLIPDLKIFREKMAAERELLGDEWLGGDHWFVFTTTNGKAIYYSYASQWWRNFTTRHNIRYIRFHDLRHTSATLLINQGVHAKVISSRLGHANISTTMNIYGHVLQSADHSAAEKLNALLPKR
ncbi:site-specific integrase [Cohnella pontilimi]|uniref:Site-specific integrase n=1 Tax=Cohnella pontilimi TaxID=2564100 RepID=A0A4U0FCZ0_9BACL|nr:tyrosine-type recombinase/integrase [Cohnella pontilimi]TJY42675.1 site-specific integrase [Cohnella pontilimi]